MSLTFVQNQSSVVTVILASAGNAVTGALDSDVLCSVSKNGQTPVNFDVTGLLTEVSGTAMPGLYAVSIPSATFDTLGEIVFYFTEAAGATVSFDPYLVKGQVFTGSLTDVMTQIFELTEDVGTVGNKVDSLTPSFNLIFAYLNAIGEATQSIETTTTTIDSNVDQVLIDITNLDTTIGDVQTAISNVQSSQDQDTLTILNEIDTKGDTVINEVNALDPLVSQINTNTSTLSQDIAGLQSDFDARVPAGETVATRSLFVNGTGTATPPTDRGIWDALGTGDVSISDLSLDVKRILGLSHENYRTTNMVYDGNGNLTNADIVIYPSEADLVADTNAIATYSMTSTYDLQNRLTSYQVVLNP